MVGAGFMEEMGLGGDLSGAGSGQMNVIWGRDL